MLWFWVIIRYFSFSEDTIFFANFFQEISQMTLVFTASGATPQNNAVISFSYSLIVPTEIVMVFFPLCEVIKAQNQIKISVIPFAYPPSLTPRNIFFRFHSFFIIFCCNQIEWQWPSNSIHYPSAALRFNFHLFSL